MLKCASFIVLLLITFLPTGIGQLLFHSNHEVKIILKYGRNGSYSRIADTILVKPNEPKSAILIKPGWIITLMDGKTQYFSFRDKLDFVLDDEPKSIHLKIPISESIIYKSLINDSISLFNQKLKPIQTKRDFSSMQQLEAFMQKDMTSFGRWADSINENDKELGVLVANQVSNNPYSLVSQFAFGIYCHHMPEDSFYSSYLKLSLAENLSKLPTPQLEDFENKLESRIGMPIPKIDLETINESIVNPGMANGKIKILYFTSSTCGPCKLLKPELEKLSNDPQYKDVQFISISLEDSENGVNAALKDAAKTKAKWQQVIKYSKEGLSTKFFIGGYPTLIIANKDAIICKKIIGFTDTTVKELKEMVEKIL